MAPHPRWLNAPTSTTWQNLGDWSTHQTYPQAAEALAVRLGSAARLNAADTVADIGCGQGDQLLVWRQQFQVGQVVGFEPNRQSADAAAQRVRHQTNMRVVCGTDRQLSTPSAPSDLLPASARSLAETASTSSTPHLKDTSSPSVVLSLDAAYHFRSRASFLRRAAAALAPGGRLALGDLFIP
ncbi:MAG: class I SAM-dependent methyltransferase, partial [Myxococcota bacterium]